MNTTKSFQFEQGSRPILISMPHNGTKIPAELQARMTESALRLVDTDWYLNQLYQFALEQGCYLICPEYSRYVIDLNRPKSDENLYPGQDTTELCPTSQFDKQAIYNPNQAPSEQEIGQRVEDYWVPYHAKLQTTLNQIKDKFGGALLFEAHSIKSKVPRFFEGQLPDFNFGNFNNTTCSEYLTDMITHWKVDGYSKVLNGRFKGGYITRAYGQPKQNIHSIQLELSQATYMNEQSLELDSAKCEQVTPVLMQMFELFYEFTDRITNIKG